MGPHIYRPVDLSFFGTELQLDEFHRLGRERDQSLSIQNRIFVSSQECRLKDGLKAVCCQLRTFLLISCNHLVEFLPIVPRPESQEANQPKGIGEGIDDRCARERHIRWKQSPGLEAKRTQSGTNGR